MLAFIFFVLMVIFARHVLKWSWWAIVAGVAALVVLARWWDNQQQHTLRAAPYRQPPQYRSYITPSALSRHEEEPFFTREVKF